MTKQIEPQKIYVLSDGSERTWHIIDANDLQLWLNDGSLEDGDIIIYPEKIKVVKSKTTLSVELVDIP